MTIEHVAGPSAVRRGNPLVPANSKFTPSDIMDIVVRPWPTTARKPHDLFHLRIRNCAILPKLNKGGELNLVTESGNKISV